MPQFDLVAYLDSGFFFFFVPGLTCFLFLVWLFPWYLVTAKVSSKLKRLFIGKTLFAFTVLQNLDFVNKTLVITLRNLQDIDATV